MTMKNMPPKSPYLMLRSVPIVNQTVAFHTAAETFLSGQGMTCLFQSSAIVVKMTVASSSVEKTVMGL